MSIEIILTGGTFDKVYFPLTGQLGFDISVVPMLLEQARLSALPAVTHLPLQDSLEMNEADRARVLDAIKQSSARQIIVIHGTDTMTETAQKINAYALDKTIVFTGAMVPARVTQSDAFFNLGFALCAVQLMPAGAVYIAMNGKVHRADQTHKNKTKGLFEWGLNHAD